MQEFLPSTIWPKSHDLDAPDDHDLLCMPQDLTGPVEDGYMGKMYHLYLAKLISLYQTRFSGNKGGVPKPQLPTLREIGDFC